MSFKSLNVRTFIGARDFEESRRFYLDLGYQEVVIDRKMSLFRINEDLGFYLQDYYVKDWVDNSMVFVEVDDIEACTAELSGKGLQKKYKGVRFSKITQFDYGRELFMHDPSGILWHYCQFKS
jgi:catechol 2,3-dioxygenase-like lactoylglutathione lyase family enzyme